MRLLVTCVVAVGALGLCGCSVSINEDTGSGNDESTALSEEAEHRTLEETIRSQLPDQVREATGRSTFVDQVACASTGTTNQYECIAKVSQAGPGGTLVHSSLGITGTCDGRVCTWRVSEG